MSRTIHKNAMSIAFFALWHLSLFLSCVVCVDWKRLGKSTHTHTHSQVPRMRTGTGNWEMKTGNWERFSSNAFGKQAQRHTKRTCVGSYNDDGDDDNWARQKTTQIRCSTTTDCRSRGTQRERVRESRRERDWYTISPFAVAVHDACQRQPISRGSAVSVQAFVYMI